MKKAIQSISWGMISEGIFYGILSMLVAEERVLSIPMLVSWGFLLVYLASRCASHYFPKIAKTLAQIAKPYRIFAWFLIVVATMIASAAD